MALDENDMAAIRKLTTEALTSEIKTAIAQAMAQTTKLVDNRFSALTKQKQDDDAAAAATAAEEAENRKFAESLNSAANTEGSDAEGVNIALLHEKHRRDLEKLRQQLKQRSEEYASKEQSFNHNLHKQEIRNRIVEKGVTDPRKIELILMELDTKNMITSENGKVGLRLQKEYGPAFFDSSTAVDELFSDPNFATYLPAQPTGGAGMTFGGELPPMQGEGRALSLTEIQAALGIE